MKIPGSQAIVTGGARRIGLALSQALLSAGAKVIVTYHRSKKEAEALLETYEHCYCVELDLTNKPSIENASKEIMKRFNTVDLLINSASNFYPKPLADISEQDWDHLHETNVKGHWFFTQALLPIMKKGLIINITDIHAQVPLKNFTSYVPHKAALKMLTRNLAIELAPNIRVNSISPGAILFPEHFTPVQKASFLEGCPLGREGSPSDIVEAVKFLILNDYITGYDLKVDGGRSLTTP